MLENKLIRASQAILKNTTLVIASGSGITADCSLEGGVSPSWEGNQIPIFRGTYGLWKHYPAFRKKLILFEELVEENFFRGNPQAFWFVYGDLWNKLSRAVPHQGYTALKNIIEKAGKQQKHWIYHSGVDNLYEKAQFDMQKFTQAKGSLFDWQCKKCNNLSIDVKAKQAFILDRIRGSAEQLPQCKQCQRILRPNINMRNDFDWIESKVADQMERMQKFFESEGVKKHSLTVLEIGAGPVQPLAREFAEIFLKNDKYRCALIRINPIKERSSQFNYERSVFEQLVKKYRVPQPDGTYKIEQELKASHVPNCIKDDFRHLVVDEEKAYLNLRNELIEIELGASEALPLLLKHVEQQQKLLQTTQNKQRKNGEQPTQNRHGTNIVFTKKRPLAEIQYESFNVDFPNELISKSGQPIFSTIDKKEANQKLVEQPNLAAQKTTNQQPILVNQAEKAQTQSFDQKDTEQSITLDGNLLEFKAPSLEDYSRYQHRELMRQEQINSANQILTALNQFSYDDFNLQQQYQYHSNMIQNTHSVQNNEFEECQLVKFLPSNLICIVKNQVVYLYDQQVQLLYQTDAILQPVQYVFFHKEMLYISTSEDLIVIQLSHSMQNGVKLMKQESMETIGVQKDRVIHSSAIVNDKIWVGMNSAQVLKVETKRSSFFSCKTQQETTVRLPQKSFLSRVTTLSFFTSNDKVTQMYDLMEIDLAVAFVENSKKYLSSEIQLFDRKSLHIIGKFTIQWLADSIQNHLLQVDPQKIRESPDTSFKVINITGAFYNLKQQRHLIFTFSCGVRAHVYIAPPRSKNGDISISEDDISIILVESTSIESCLDKFDKLNSTISQKQYKPPLLSKRIEMNLQPPFKYNFSLGEYRLVAARSSQQLSVFVVQYAGKLVLITDLQQNNQTISTAQPLKGSEFYDIVIEDLKYYQNIKVLTNYGLEYYQQKTLRDHLGSYLHLASLVGGLENSQQIGLDLEYLLVQYPIQDILAILIDFIISDYNDCKPIYHDSKVQNFYFNQCQTEKLQTEKVNQNIQNETRVLFDLLLQRYREQYDKSKWEICSDAISGIISQKSSKILNQYPFKSGQDGISQQLVKETLVTLDNLVDFLEQLQYEGSIASILFCKKLHEICSFIQITMYSLQWDVSLILNQVFELEQKLVQDVNVYELMNVGLDSYGLQIFLETYLTFQKHNKKICHEIFTRCCGYFLNYEFLILSEARQKLIQKDSTQQQIRQAVQVICDYVNKTDLLATFELLIENFELYGLDPSIAYLQNFIETKFIHLQWCEANQRELTNTLAIQDSRIQAMDILLEITEEIGIRVQNKSKQQPKSNLECINVFRQKLEKIKSDELIQRGLRYLILRIEKIDEQWLHNNLFKTLIDLGLTQYIRKSNSKHLVQFFKDKAVSQSDSEDHLEITADNLILLSRFEDCYQFLIEAIGSERNFSNCNRPTTRKLAIKKRMILLQKAELCIEKLDSSPNKQRWSQEILRFRRLLMIQCEVLDILTSKQKGNELSEEDQFMLKQLDQDIFSENQLIELCKVNCLFSHMLQAITLKVDCQFVPLQSDSSQDIQEMVYQCYQGLIENTKTEDLANQIEILHQIRQYFSGQKLQRAKQLGSKATNKGIEFFPLQKVLALAISENKASDRLMNFLFQQSTVCEIVDIVMQLATTKNSALITLAPILSGLVSQEVRFKDTIEENLLIKLKNELVDRYINQELRHSASVVNQAVNAVADIDKLLSF